MLEFSVSVLLVGVVLLVASALSGWLRGTVLSVTVLAVAAGAGLSLAGVLEVRADAPWLSHVIELALVLTLFADGLTAEHELVRRRWRDPARALALAMPITLLLIAVAAKGLFADLTWAEALLLGAVLAPTDPVVTSTVVTSSRVPAPVRHTLNLESGPKGVASILFALYVLESQAPDRSLAFDVAAFVILASVLAHGLTDTVGARWVERRMQEVR